MCIRRRVLEDFQIATQVLSGSKYLTISLVLLFRAEIVGLAALQDLPTDCAMVILMKQRIRQDLSRRLPVSLTLLERCLIGLQTFRPLCVSPHGRFAQTLDDLPHGRFALWAIRPMVDSPPGRFAHTEMGSDLRRFAFILSVLKVHRSQVDNTLI